MGEANADEDQINLLQHNLAAERALRVAAEQRAEMLQVRLLEERKAVSAADFDGGGTCTYCHAVGACPRCWGRAAITALEQRAEAAERRVAELEARLQGLAGCLVIPVPENCYGTVHLKGCPNHRSRP